MRRTLVRSLIVGLCLGIAVLGSASMALAQSGLATVTGIVTDNTGGSVPGLTVTATNQATNIAYTGEMDGIRGLCRYVDADPITMAIDVDMEFGRGPAATSDTQHYRYWVAVSRRGRNTLAKQYYDVTVRFPHGQPIVTHTEHIDRITIPRANADISGENFEILVGFDLTPEELQFNRDGRRFRIDAAANAARAEQQEQSAPAPQPQGAPARPSQQ